MAENLLTLTLDARRTIKRGPDAILARQRERLAEMVAFARANSPFYRELYRDLPDHVDDVRMLPVTNKKVLMEHFDDWVTDRDVRYGEVREFMQNPDLVGHPFHKRYVVCSSSGTTGTRGIALHDKRVYNTVAALSERNIRRTLTARDVFRLLARGLRGAMVFATGDHFTACSTITNLRLRFWPAARVVRMFNVLLPLPELVSELNAFQPAVLFSWSRTTAQLAKEQDAGRLKINPALVCMTGQSLDEEEYAAISKTFGRRVLNLYGATEAPELSFNCAHNWHHVNADWYVFEPVDADYRPTPPGEQSHTVLLTSLMNRLQPILRYDFGDSVVQRPDPCPCVTPLPAFRVRGRSSQLLSLEAHGLQKTLAPEVLYSALYQVHDASLFQVVQTRPDSLRIRFSSVQNADPDRVWQELSARLRRLLDSNGLTGVAIERADERPEQTPGGKFNAVIPLDRELSRAIPT